MLYAVVDIETTGSYAMGSGITEIAIVIHDGKEVLDQYETLVNPQRPIPRFIQSLTGISPEMVANAPVFEEIAETVHELLKGKIFVAHNVNFDYSFVKYQLEQCGYSFDTRKLCTVRLARKLVPGLPSYSLGKLCRSLGIGLINHHRAGGDAHATAQLLSLLVARDDGQIALMLKGRNREQYLPPHLPVEQLDNLPGGPGVYYFYNQSGKVIYIGKAVNLQKRVKSHFSNNKAGKQKQDFLRDIHRISYKPVATDLMAHILESVEIRKLWPVYNRSQKGYHPRFGLFTYEDRNGYKRLGIEKHKHHYRPVYTFNTITEGHHWLRRLASEFGLCARLCNLAREADCSNGHPADTCGEEGCTALLSAETYNARVEEALLWIGRHLPTFALIDRGRTAEEHSCILISQGNVYGMGYVPSGDAMPVLEKLQEQLEPVQDNDYIRNLVYRYAEEFPEKRIDFAG